MSNPSYHDSLFWGWTRNPNQIGRGYQLGFPLNRLNVPKPKSTRKSKKALRKPRASRKPQNLADTPDYLQRFLPEIRTMIFRFVLEPRPEIETVIVRIQDPAYYCELNSTPKFRLGPPAIRCGARNVRLLETCKWIHAEAATLLYRETKFTFTHRKDAHHFLLALSRKYLDAIKHVRLVPNPCDSPCLYECPNLRNLKTLSLPIYSRVYALAKDAKKNGFLMEELVEIRVLLVLRGLTSIVIEDPEDIPKNHPELVDIKKKLDTLIVNSVKRPRKTYGGAASVSMDCFIDEEVGTRSHWPGHRL